MSTGTMTSKGQITVPKDVREQLGLTPGTKVTFARNSEGDFVISASQPSIMGLQGRLKHGGPPVSVDAMDAAIADGAAGDP